MTKLNKINIFVILFILLASYTFADKKIKIYSKLKCCPCKSDFADCNCDSAKEMKAYIDALLEVDLDKDQILKKVAKKYSLDAIIDEKAKKEIENKLIEEAGPNRPQIYIHPLSYNLGKVSKTKGTLELVVEVHNKSKATLTISDLKTFCACTTVRLKTKDNKSSVFGVEGATSGWEANLAGGEKGELVIVTDLNHPHVQVGHMLRRVEIKSNDPIYSIVSVDFEADIVE